MNNCHKIFFLLLSTFATIVKSTEDSVQTYKTELKSFKESEDYESLFNKKMPFELRVIQADVENCKELTFSQRFQESIFINLFDGIVATGKTMPKLYKYIENICNQANMPMPLIFIPIHEGLFNAMAKKLFFNSGAILIGQDIINECDDNELEAVIAHEIGHIKNNHTNKMFFTQLVSYLAIKYLAELCLTDTHIPYLAILAASSIPSRLLSKRFERQADEFACSCGKTEGLIKLFEKVEKKHNEIDAMYDKTKHLITKNKDGLSTISYYLLLARYYCEKVGQIISKAINKSIIGSHPSPKERIKFVEDYIANQEAVVAAA